MKELLTELGFEHLPMLNEFRKELKRINPFGFVMSEEKNFIDEFSKKMAQELDSIDNYGDFIDQPLTKGMFIPCSEDGEVLSEPIDNSMPFSCPDNTKEFIKDLVDMYAVKLEQYQQAKDRVLFETDSQGCVTMGLASINNPYQTIEQAINNGVKLILI